VLNTSLIKKKVHPYIFSFSYAFLLGLTIELFQFFIPYRSFELGDIFSNFFGSIAGIFLKIEG
jgi:glycopeptide antibiotics resistance protein